MSSPETLFDSKMTLDDQPLFWDTQLVGGGLATHSTQFSRVRLSVAGTIGDSAVRQTKRHFNYSAGKSHLNDLTAIIAPTTGGEAGVRRRMGAFSANDGVFFELDGTTMRCVVRSSTSGSPDDRQFNQADWSIDKMDGTGASGLTLDWSKGQIMVIDYEWLGLGGIRFGFVVNNITYYVHYVGNANDLDVVYMRTGSQPIRYEITNTATTGVPAYLDQICCSVMSEGGGSVPACSASGRG